MNTSRKRQQTGSLNFFCLLLVSFEAEVGLSFPPSFSAYILAMHYAAYKVHCSGMDFGVWPFSLCCSYFLLTLSHSNFQCPFSLLLLFAFKAAVYSATFYSFKLHSNHV